LEASSFHAFDRLNNPISANHCVVMAIEIAKLRDIRHGAFMTVAMPDRFFKANAKLKRLL
jgi:hypothetical protein